MPIGEKPKQNKPDLTISLPEFLVDGTDQSLREFVADLFAAIGAMRSLRRALASTVGLSAAEFSVLLAVWTIQRKGPQGIRGIARHLHVDATHVTAEVGKLVAKGFLQKRRNPDDTRAVIVQITNRGTTVLSQLAPLLRRINDRLFSGNSASDIATVSKFAKHIANESRNSIGMAKAFALRTSIQNQAEQRKLRRQVTKGKWTRSIARGALTRRHLREKSYLLGEPA
jgi:DNA-binding MarR family transcriptional regulator